jgi:hypothetical protein
VPLIREKARLEQGTEFGVSLGQLWLTDERDGLTGVLTFDAGESRTEPQVSETD